MKKTKIVLISLLLIVFLLPIFYSLIIMGKYSRLQKVEIQNVVADDAPVLRVAADYDFSPYSFYDNNNQVSGLDVELINEIANRLGMKAEIIFTDWISCKKLLQEKKTDLIMGLEIFSNLEGVLKTIAVSNDQLGVFGKNGINDISVLKDKKVGLITNSVIEKFYDLNCEYVPFYTNTQVLEAVEEGKIDYGICHESVAKKIIEQKNYNIIPSIDLMKSYPAIGVRDDIPELRDHINDILVELSNEGFIKKLDEKWLIRFANHVTFFDLIKKDGKLYTIYYILFFVTLFIVIFFLEDSYRREMIMKNTLQYQASLKKQNDMLISIANVYYTMHAINLVENTVKEIQSSLQVKQYVNKIEDAVSQMKNVMENTVVPEDVEIAKKFTDLTTLVERMGNKKSILAELRGTEIGWFCAQFIAMAYNEKGEVTEVIFTTQSIDEMKKEKEHLLQLSRYDELTSLLNRNGFESKRNELAEKHENRVSVIVLDVNNLKNTNDKIGHHAGDELICGAAYCIQESVKNSGTCFRMGGDEFLIIIENEKDNQEEIITQLKNKINEWKGNYVEKLSLSIGSASSDEMEDFTIAQLDELIRKADKRMYEDKAMYYKTLGIERRQN